MERFDSHMHTRWSPDASSDDATLLAEAAVRAGLTGIAITDHCDIGAYLPVDWRSRLNGSQQDIAQAQQRFSGRLLISAGIELGQPLEELDATREVLQAAQYDVVLASLHNLPGEDDFYFLGPRPGLDRPALVARYFDGLLEIARWGQFDVLTHLTLPYRYFGYGPDVPPVRSFEELLRELFAILAQKGKALEVNLSGLFNPSHGRTMPELWELSLFRECGGELVTLASDAHSAVAVGRGVDTGLELLRAAGFTYQTFFKKRAPVLYPIV